MTLTQQSRIIVLHLTKYGDSGLVVHAIDSEAGRCSYMLRGAGRNKQVAIGPLHNLAILDIISVANPRRSMAQLKEYEPAVHLDSLRSDIDKNAIALFISELLYRTVVEQNYDPHLFAWLCEAIVNLDAIGQSAPDNTPGSSPAIANFHLWFLAGLCTVLGFGPSGEGLFDGCDMFNAENLALLRQISAAGFSEAMAIPLNGSRRRDFCNQMVRYLSYHLGLNLNLRSLDVLHDLYR